MKTIKITCPDVIEIIGENVWHGDAWNGDDRTLCGLAYEGEGHYVDANPVFSQTEKINCIDCINLINHCKSIKKLNII